MFSKSRNIVLLLTPPFLERRKLLDMDFSKAADDHKNQNEG